MIKVLIVDDHALVRMGIRRLLEDLPDVDVIADAKSGEEALELVKTNHPDVILLDMKMPGMDGLEVTRRMTRSYPTIKIIVVTALSSEPMPLCVLRLGAWGYVTKESGAEEMAKAIRTVARGEKYLSAEMAQKMVINRLEGTQEDSPFELLSEREMEVMLMICRGMTAQNVAERLFLSAKTVNGYRYRIFEKLNIKNDVELIFLAIKYQIIEQPSTFPA